MNENRWDVFKTWYNMTAAHARHTVVLDLWSWLIESSRYQRFYPLPSVPVQAAPSQDVFSVLDLSSLVSPLWHAQIHPFTARNMYNHSDIPDRCFEAVREETEEERRIATDCAEQFANSMQHGTANGPYHRFIARALAEHILRIVGRVRAVPRPLPTQRATQCVGQWGMGGLQDLPESPGLETVVVDQSGFEYGGLWPNQPAKITLHANSVDSRAVLDCPDGFTAGRLGYIMHSEESEGGTFSINTKTVVKTHSPLT
jgi:hypothetical protein